MFNQSFNQSHGKSGKPEGSTKWASACPLCGAKYNPIESKVVAEKENAFLLYTKCKTCSSSVVATLVAGAMGISSVGLVTDLTYEDVVKFKDSERISENDVLDVYNFFDELREDIRKIMG